MTGHEIKENVSISYILDLHFGTLHDAMVGINWLFEGAFLHICHLTIVSETYNCVIYVWKCMKVFLPEEITLS